MILPPSFSFQDEKVFTSTRRYNFLLPFGKDPKVLARAADKFFVTREAVMIIEVKTVKSHGLETYQVVVNGTVLNTYLSKEMADFKVRCYLQAWNVDKIGRKVS